MNIIRLNSTHAQAYRDLRLQGLKESPEAFGSSYEEESLKDVSFFEGRLSEKQNITYGMFIDSALVGTLTLLTSDRLKTKHNGHLVAMYVDIHHRREGIRKVLIQQVFEYAKAHGIINIFLTVTATNSGAIKLYEHMGFERYGIEKREIYYQNQYFDSILMAYYL